MFRVLAKPLQLPLMLLFVGLVSMALDLEYEAWKQRLRDIKLRLSRASDLRSQERDQLKAEIRAIEKLIKAAEERS